MSEKNPTIIIKNDNRKIVKKDLESRLPIIMEAIGQTAEGYAKDNCPVDTGRLRNSITYGTSEKNGIYNYYDDAGHPYAESVGKAEKNKVYIGTNVNYAPKIEYSDSNHNVGQGHFLRDSLDKHKAEYKEILKSGLK